MKVKDGYRATFVVEEFNSIPRLLNLVARKSKSFPPPIMAYEMDNKDKYVYSTFFSACLGSSKEDIIHLTGTSSKRPKNYIRYRTTPTEIVEFKKDKRNPLGAYLPIIRLFSSSQCPRKKGNSSFSSNFNLNTFSTIDESQLDLLRIEMKTLQDLVRFALNTVEYPIIFTIKEKTMYYYFLLRSPLQVGEKKFGRMIYWRGQNKINKPFVTVKDTSLVTSKGEKIRALSYARLVYTKEIPKNLISE